MKKKGISGVIGIVVMVLLVIVAVALVWVLISNSVGKTKKDIDSKILFYDVKLSIVEGSVLVNGTNVIFLVERESGGGEIAGFLVVLKDDKGSTFVSEKYKETAVGELQRIKVEVFDYEHNLNKISEIEVYGIVKSEGETIISSEPLGFFDFARNRGGSGGGGGSSSGPGAACGDGTVNQGSEQCDDGNLANGDGCSSSCQIEASICGNGIIDFGEQCDDGNGLTNADGCNSICQEQEGWQCTGVPSFCYLTAFPGAEGYGALTKGGRGQADPIVCIVNNTEDYGSLYLTAQKTYYNTSAIINGSLRYCLEEVMQPRFVVFSVGGTINLSSSLVIAPHCPGGENSCADNDYITIAGETAPGGIQLIKSGISILNSKEIIIRNLRVRVGDEGIAGEQDDSLMIYAYDGRNASKIIVDSSSLEWAQDEELGIGGDTGGFVSEVTVQRSILGEGAKFAYQSPSASCSACGALISYNVNNFTFAKNLIIHDTYRAPRLTDTPGPIQIINNVVYNYKSAAMDIISDLNATESPGYSSNNDNPAIYAEYMGNYVKTGPETLPYAAELIYFWNQNLSHPLPTQTLYIKDNIGYYRTENTQPDWYFLKGRAKFDYPPYPINDSLPGALAGALRSTPLMTQPVIAVSYLGSIESSSEADSLILSQAGSRSGGGLDSVDLRLISEFNSGAGDSGPPSDGNNRTIFTVYSGATPQQDSDSDGIADAWEDANGLDRNDASDFKGDINNDGYMNIENYLHSLF